MRKKLMIVGIIIILLAAIAGCLYMQNQKEEKAKAKEAAFWAWRTLRKLIPTTKLFAPYI